VLAGGAWGEHSARCKPRISEPGQGMGGGCMCSRPTWVPNTAV